MVNLSSLPPLREIIAAHDLRAEKSLGQNFLLDLNLTDKIARLACNFHDMANIHVLEIGPGPGGLTRAILSQEPKAVTAIEFDPRAINALQSLREVSGGVLDIIHEDALKADLTGMSDAPRAIIANLPYNIATPLLIGWLEQIHTDPRAYDFMALMFQKEVGDRITAAPGSKAYGRLSVLSQFLCETKKLVELPPGAFTPPPKIKSSVIYFKPRELPEKPDFKVLETITAAAFGQRRKMLRSSLKDYLPVLEGLGIDPTLRAENLSVDDYIRIACACS